MLEFIYKPFGNINRIDSASKEQLIDFIKRANALVANLKVNDNNKNGIRRALHFINNVIGNNYHDLNRLRSRLDEFENLTEFTRSQDFRHLVRDKSQTLTADKPLPKPFRQCYLIKAGFELDPTTIAKLVTVFKHIPETEIKKIIEGTPIYSVDYSGAEGVHPYHWGQRIYIPQSKLETFSNSNNSQLNLESLLAHELAHAIFNNYLGIGLKEDNVFADYRTKYLPLDRQFSSVSETSEIISWTISLLTDSKATLNDLITSDRPTYAATQELLLVALNDWQKKYSHSLNEFWQRTLVNPTAWAASLETLMNNVSPGSFDEFVNNSKRIFIEESNNIVEYGLKQMGKL